MKAPTAKPASALCTRDMIANHGCWTEIWSRGCPESEDMRRTYVLRMLGNQMRDGDDSNHTAQRGPSSNATRQISDRRGIVVVTSPLHSLTTRPAGLDLP